ncbi:hypothetical protein ZWY2020_016308 [Hordeum vulgare]|uniref:Acidic protein n=1 Tax=Hordeum vulgare subsp. vulgare TaxID=112509 RepID=A0A8I6YQ64_HORVV|nr:hypothetical protein ZWY2020_016308 [Hordeum vulgare]
MEGKKKARVKAAAVCVLLVILLSAQQLPVGDAASMFCRCYVSCYSDCRLRRPPLFCKPLCGVTCALGAHMGGGCPGVCGEASGCVVDGVSDGAADADAAATCVEDCRRLREAMHG